jgi:hypothetical protein
MDDRGHDALQPQQSDRLLRLEGIMACGDPRSPRPLPAAARNAEFGTCAAPDTSNGEPSAAVMARFAVTSSSPRNASVRSLSGLGITFRVTSVMTASVPQDPASSLQRS